MSHGRFVAEVGEFLETLGGGNGGENAAGFFQARPWISGSVQKENRAADAGGILDRIVGKTVEACLAASPKNQQLGAGKGGDAHGLETMPHGVEHLVKYSLHNDGIRAHMEIGRASWRER